MLGTLNSRQIDQLLRSEVVGRIGCVSNGKVYVVPISYVYDGEYIYGHSADGLKIQMMLENPDVCFQVDHITDLSNWQSAIIWGVFEDLENADAEYALGLFVDRMQPISASETSLSSHVSASAGRPHDMRGRQSHMYRIAIKERTGRFEKQKA
jgi:uncharacterized protein